MTLKTGSKSGFTLIEIMATTAVLAFGIVFLYEAFFISLDAANYYSSYMRLSPWLEEKIWQTQDTLCRLGEQAQIDTNGQLKEHGKDFQWGLAYNLIDEEQDLYKIDVVLSWREGKKEFKLLRTAYAMYEEKE